MFDTRVPAEHRNNHVIMTNGTTAHDISELRRKLHDLKNSEPYMRCESMRKQKDSNLHSLGKGHSETLYSQRISQIIDDPSFNRYLRKKPIALLLNLIAYNAMNDQDNNVANGFDKDLANGLDRIRDIVVCQVQTEYTFPTKDRLDILIEGVIDKDDAKETFVLCIENKVTSQEGSKNREKKDADQCERYYNQIENEFSDKKKYRIYTFLAPEKPKKLSSEHFVSITYQELLDDVLHPLVVQSEYNTNKLSPASIDTLKDFINTIQQETIDNKRIAMTPEYKKLLQDFWDANKDLILEASRACASEEEAADIQKQVEVRNRDKYVLITNPTNGTKVNVGGKNKIAKVFVEEYCKLNPSTTFEGMQGILNGVKTPNILSKQKKANNTTFPIDGKDWYVANKVWGEGTPQFKKLKKVIEDNGMQLTVIP
jgi:hypothetical protein